MSMANALQAYLFAVLTADASLTEAVTGVFDLPKDDEAEPYVSFGPADEIPENSECIVADRHTAQIDIWSDEKGFQEAKAIAGMIKKALRETELEFTGGELIGLRIVGIRYLREGDNRTAHGVVTLEALIQEIADN